MIRQKSPSAPIGGCLWGVQCFLDNAVGDLCVGGVGVFHGEYEKDPKNTADYYKVEESGIFWHSKDICEVQRFNGRDQLTFTSRANCVVKIRGAKVDLAAIEQVVCALPFRNFVWRYAWEGGGICETDVFFWGGGGGEGGRERGRLLSYCTTKGVSQEAAK
jgi:hypothetical protein